MRNSGSNKNIIANLKNSKNSNNNNKGKKSQQVSSSSIIKIDKRNQAPDPQILFKKRNYSDNNPQQQSKTKTSNNKYDININSNEIKGNLLKTINIDLRNSFVETKPTKTLSPKNLLDVYNNKKYNKQNNAHNLNKDSISSTNLNTNINSNSNSNSISNNPFHKNPLSISLHEVKFSSFNKNIIQNPSMNSNKNNDFTIGTICSAKDSKIGNTVNQSISRGILFLN